MLNTFQVQNIGWQLIFDSCFLELPNNILHKATKGPANVTQFVLSVNSIDILFSS